MRQLYNNAKSPKEIDAVYFAVQQLKKNPHVTAVKGLMDPIVAAVNTKREKIKLAGLSEQLAQISKELMTVTDFAGMITLKSELTKIRHARSQILLVDKETDLLLKETLGAIDQKIVEYQDEHKEQLTQEIDKNCARLTEYMQGIDYLPQITSVYSAELWKQTEQML
ncbi:hypothetical protein KA013_01870 [Patescibacteria group bacterium]|nr:hypothetical protein [Patescibacteria group bacterium]